MTPSSPSRISLRMYQVGFGDCFLLTFHYGTQDNRHVLIDFGTTEKPEGAPQDLSLQIARDIHKACGGHLHGVIATHRHADHINGFATGKSGKEASGDIIRKCQPGIVVQPWTEDPQASPSGHAGSVTRGQSFLQAVNSMHEIADSVWEGIECMSQNPRCAKGDLEQLKLIAANNRGLKDIANRSAVDNLTEMGSKGIAEYLSYRQNSKLEGLLDGVKIHVLGPPTLDQTETILKQRARDEEEFWQLHMKGPAFWQMRLTDNTKSWQLQAEESKFLQNKAEDIFSNAMYCGTSSLVPPHTRWFLKRMNSVRSEQIDHLLELVRIMDSVLNNTSLILVFEVGDKKLLFPGDAQIESWSYVLEHPQDQEQNRQLLKEVNLYKVGHHGSRNATPKSLWKLMGRPGITSVVSTKAGKHGDIDAHSEVPRETLVQELKKFRYHTTQDLRWNDSDPKGPLFKELTLAI